MLTKHKLYYDRYLKNLKRLNNKMEAIGVAFSFQNCKKIPSSKYDFQLNKCLFAQLMHCNADLCMNCF